MDLMTLARKSANLGSRYDGLKPACDSGSGGPEQENRLNDVVKKAKPGDKPFKNRWGGNEYPVDVKEYGQWMSLLQTLSWVLRDCGYEIMYLTRNGLHYTNDYVNYPQLFDTKQSKVVALVATGRDGRHWRFTHDDSTIRVRKFDNITRAISPLQSGEDPTSKPISERLVKEIVRVMATQSRLDPKDPMSLRRYGRVVQSKNLKPTGAGIAKSLLNLQFRKM